MPCGNRLDILGSGLDLTKSNVKRNQEQLSGFGNRMLVPFAELEIVVEGQVCVWKSDLCGHDIVHLCGGSGWKSEKMSLDFSG